MTLIELLVMLAVMALLVTQGVPALGHLLREHRLQAASYALYQALSYARSEAIRQGVPVLMVNEQRNWNQGWKIFADQDGNGQQSASEHTLRVDEALPGGLQLYANAPLRRYVRFAPNGYSIRTTGGFQIGSFYLCTAGGSGPARRIVLSRGGRLRIERLADGDTLCAP